MEFAIASGVEELGFHEPGLRVGVSALLMLDHFARNA